MDMRIPYVLYHNKKIDFLFTGIQTNTARIISGRYLRARIQASPERNPLKFQSDSLKKRITFS